MSEPTREDIIYLIRKIRRDCDEVLQLAEKLLPESDWLSTSEFARRKGLEPKTVSNYVGQGKYKRIRKRSTRYEIHISELEEER